MATVIEQWPDKRARRRKGGAYAKYMDGQVWRVDLADHPGINSLNALRNSVWMCAKRLGVDVQTTTDADGALIVRAITNGQK